MPSIATLYIGPEPVILATVAPAVPDSEISLLEKLPIADAVVSVSLRVTLKLITVVAVGPVTGSNWPAACSMVAIGGVLSMS